MSGLERPRGWAQRSSRHVRGAAPASCYAAPACLDNSYADEDAMSATQTRQRRAKIVATLGPATDGHEPELVAAGLDVARLNFSHGVAAEHQRRCSAIRAAARAC